MKAQQILTLSQEENNNLQIKETFDYIVDYFNKKFKVAGGVSITELPGLGNVMFFPVFVEGFDSASIEQQNKMMHQYTKNFANFFPKTKVQVSPLQHFFIEINSTKPLTTSFVNELSTSSLLTVMVLASKIDNKEKDIFHLFIYFSKMLAIKLHHNTLIKHFKTEKDIQEFLTEFKIQMINIIDLTAKAIRLTSVE